MKQITKCPECEGTVRTEDGEHVCVDCSLVVGESRIDQGPDWRDSEGKHAHPINHRTHDLMHTVIGIDGQREMSARKRKKMERLRTWNHRSTHQEQKRSLIKGINEIRRMCCALGLSDSVQKQTCHLYRQHNETTTIRGWSVEQISTGCINIVCRVQRNPVRVQKIVNVSRGVERVDVFDATKKIKRDLELSVDLVHPRDLIPGILQEIEEEWNRDKQSARREALPLVEHVWENEKFSGVAPSSIAAAAVYISLRRSNQDLSQKRMAEATDTSHATIRKTHQMLLKHEKAFNR